MKTTTAAAHRTRSTIRVHFVRPINLHFRAERGRKEKHKQAGKPNTEKGVGGIGKGKCAVKERTSGMRKAQNEWWKNFT